MEMKEEAFRDLFREQFAEDAASVDQLELELQSAQAALDIPWGVGPSVVEAFRDRKAKISQLKEAIDKAQLEKAQKETNIEQVKVCDASTDLEPMASCFGNADLQRKCTVLCCF